MPVFSHYGIFGCDILVLNVPLVCNKKMICDHLELLSFFHDNIGDYFFMKKVYHLHVKYLNGFLYFKVQVIEESLQQHFLDFIFFLCCCFSFFSDVFEIPDYTKIISTVPWT